MDAAADRLEVWPCAEGFAHIPSLLPSALSPSDVSILIKQCCSTHSAREQADDLGGAYDVLDSNEVKDAAEVPDSSSSSSSSGAGKKKSVSRSKRVKGDTSSSASRKTKSGAAAARHVLEPLVLLDSFVVNPHMVKWLEGQLFALDAVMAAAEVAELFRPKAIAQSVCDDSVGGRDLADIAAELLAESRKLLRGSASADRVLSEAVQSASGGASGLTDKIRASGMNSADYFCRQIDKAALGNAAAVAAKIKSRHQNPNSLAHVDDKDLRALVAPFHGKDRAIARIRAACEDFGGHDGADAAAGAALHVSSAELDALAEALWDSIEAACTRAYAKCSREALDTVLSTSVSPSD